MGSVHLQFLGCGDAFGSGGRMHACLRLDGGAEELLIDCGATSLTALKRERIDPGSIGWIALSHLHGDHFGGLPWLILDGRFSGRVKPLVIAGPVGSRARVEQAFEALYPGALSGELPFEIEYLELCERQPCKLGPATVTPFEVVHGSGAPAYALRVEYGEKVIGYSGDTEWVNALLDVSREADLFVCECNFFDTEGPGHVNYRTLMAHRDELTCRRLVLTHMSEEMLARSGELALETAEDGLRIAI